MQHPLKSRPRSFDVFSSIQNSLPPQCKFLAKRLNWRQAFASISVWLVKSPFKQSINVESGTNYAENHANFHAICNSNKNAGLRAKTVIRFELILNYLPMRIITMNQLLNIKTACLSRRILPCCRSCSLFEILIPINFENIWIDDDI